MYLIFTVNSTTKNRKEVKLDPETLAILQIQAEKQGRKLKNYMEQILKERANNFELTEEYKASMDKILDKHYEGKLKYISEDEFRRLTARK